MFRQASTRTKATRSGAAADKRALECDEVDVALKRVRRAGELPGLHEHLRKQVLGAASWCVGIPYVGRSEEINELRSNAHVARPAYNSSC